MENMGKDFENGVNGGINGVKNGINGLKEGHKIYSKDNYIFDKLVGNLRDKVNNISNKFVKGLLLVLGYVVFAPLWLYIKFVQLFVGKILPLENPLIQVLVIILAIVGIFISIVTFNPQDYNL